MRQQARLAFCLVLATCVWLMFDGVAAQQPAKRPITHDIYDGWKSIQGTKLSRDGTWLIYTLALQDGDGELVVRNLKTHVEKRQARGRDAVLTADDQFVVFAVAPVKAAVDKAKKEKKKAEDQPKAGLGVLNLATGDVFVTTRVKSFKLPEDSGKYVAYLLEAPEKKPDAKDDKKEIEATGENSAGAKAEAKAAGKPDPKAEAGSGDAKKKKDKKKDPGTDLIVRELGTGTQTTIAEVAEYAWSKDGAWLAYGVSSAAKTPEKDGAYARRTADGATRALLSGLGHYKGFAFDDKAAQLAFLSDRDAYKKDVTTFALYFWPTTADAATQLVAESSKGMPEGMAVSENGTLDFSKDGARLFFGYAKPPTPEPPDDAPDPVKVDLWHWKDPELQSMQKVRAEEEKKRNYQAAVYPKDKSIIALASPDMPTVRLTEDLPIALGASDVPYRQLTSWDMGYNDYFLVTLQDGARQKMLEKAPFDARLSPGGKYVIYFDASSHDWMVYRVADHTRINLTAKLGVKFENEHWDTPDLTAPYGVAGWTEGDGSVWLYDRYDIWEVRFDGVPARMLTSGVGRRQKLVFRYQRVDSDEGAAAPGRRRGGAGSDQPIKLDKPVLLATTDDVSKASGYYRITVPAPPVAPTTSTTSPKKPAATNIKAAVPAPAAPLADPVKVVMLDKSVGGLVKARNADVYLHTEQRFEEFPNLWVSDGTFGNPTKITEANPQQAQFLWGRSELIDYRNADGKVLRAILTKPENFDPAKKYPLIVYIYEELTAGLHRYVAPAPGGSSINVARYASNGYIVLQPDIEYEIGYPGDSAYKCVIPAVQHLVEQGYIDPARIGIQGHSWGGYQISYMITRTNMFRAVEAGASVVDMVSAYGGIRWGTGMSRAFQYERTQSRIGAPPWQRSLQFIENSPIFWVEKVNTPYLTMANDEDDAVPWQQGIEFFSALRRLGKEAYMFSFNGEKHGLRERENQKYWTVHMAEFFDHYLLGAPLPQWMEKGVPYLERGKRDMTPFYGKK
ncbi:MAG: prolyl oligopeptidase family serine peptidase [Acidobacteriota bacterium]